MAFTYEFTLDSSFPEGERLFFDSWCDDAWGDVQIAPIKIAIARVGNKKGFVMTNGPCMPMTKGGLKPGDEIVSDTVIGIAAAEGENIPYEKPNCVFVETL